MSGVPEEHLLCPICLEIPPEQIFQCRNGHHICKGCKTKLKDCPTCRVPFGKTASRNLALESILDSMSFECPHLKWGCKEKLSRKDLSRHEITCKFRQIYLCQNIGVPACKFILSSLPQLNTIHLREHGIKECSGTDVLLSFENLFEFIQNLNNLQNRPVKWEPILWKLENDPYSPTFIIFCWTQERKSISWACLNLGSSEEADAAKYSVEYSIGNVFGGGKESKLSWTSTAVPFPRLDELMKTPKNPIPLTFFTNYVKGMQTFEDRLQNDGLLVRIKMTAKSKGSSSGDSGNDKEPKRIQVFLIQ